MLRESCEFSVDKTWIAEGKIHPCGIYGLQSTKIGSKRVLKN